MDCKLWGSVWRLDYVCLLCQYIGAEYDSNIEKWSAYRYYYLTHISAYESCNA